MEEGYQGYQNLSHVVFVLKNRRKVLFGRARRYVVEIFPALTHQKECQIVESHMVSNHVHMYIAIPLKYAVASVIGFWKGNSVPCHSEAALWQRVQFHKGHLGVRGYTVSTFGFELE